MGLDKALGLVINHYLNFQRLEKRLTTLTRTYSVLKLMPLLLNGIKLTGSHICSLEGTALTLSHSLFDTEGEAVTYDKQVS